MPQLTTPRSCTIANVGRGSNVGGKVGASDGNVAANNTSPPSSRVKNTPSEIAMLLRVIQQL